MVNLHYLSQIFHVIAEIKNNDHVAEVQTNPQVPSPLSESIILHLLRDGKIKLFDKGLLKVGDFKETPGWEFRKGGYGDITGYQQSGLKDFKLADPVQHVELFKIAEDNIKDIEHNEDNFERYSFLLKLFDKADIINQINFDKLN